MTSRAASPEERQRFAEQVARQWGLKTGDRSHVDIASGAIDDLARAVPGSVSVSALIGRDHRDCETCWGLRYVAEGHAPGVFSVQQMREQFPCSGGVEILWTAPEATS